MDAVGCHDEVGFDLPVVELREGPLVAPADPDESASEVERVRAQALDHGSSEHLLQHAAMDGELGPGVAGGDPARFPPDLLPPLGAVDEGRRRDPEGAQLVEEAERVELAHRMGEQVDADAEGT